LVGAGGMRQVPNPPVENTVTLVQEANDSREADVYPNPTSGEVTLTLNNELKGTLRVTMVNSSGSALQIYNYQKSNKAFKQVINTSGLSKGTYFLKMEIGGRVIVKRFIKL
jgi:hypothetical protein